MKGTRRVVTGLDSGGKPVVTSDAEPPLTGGNETLNAWAVDLWEMATVPPELTDEGKLTTKGGFPESGSLVFRMVQLPPESTIRENMEEAKSYYGREVLIDSEEFGMHRSDTVDMIVILSGEVWMKLQDSDEVLLKAGDTLIQRGTVHTWRNRSQEPCIMAAVLVGTESNQLRKVSGSS